MIPGYTAPFVAEKTDYGFDIFQVRDADGQHITIKRTTAAQAIARILNAHDDLVAALRELVSNGFSDQELAWRFSFPRERITAARAALAKAEGRTP